MFVAFRLTQLLRPNMTPRTQCRNVFAAKRCAPPARSTTATLISSTRRNYSQGVSRIEKLDDTALVQVYEMRPAWRYMWRAFTRVVQLQLLLAFVGLPWLVYSFPDFKLGFASFGMLGIVFGTCIFMRAYLRRLIFDVRMPPQYSPSSKQPVPVLIRTMNFFWGYSSHTISSVDLASTLPRGIFSTLSKKPQSFRAKDTFVTAKDYRHNFFLNHKYGTVFRPQEMDIFFTQKTDFGGKQ